MREPESFGKYRLERRLAFGGMAEIFLARLEGDRGFSKTVVLKRILPQYGTDRAFVQMFIDEALIAARLTHPNVVQVYDFGDVDGVYFIAMEWVDGVDLRRILRGKNRDGAPLEPSVVAAVGEGICRGLSYAHSVCGDDGAPLGIVHRDISPHNIMISRAGAPKVMDFGIAKARARSTNTATGMIKGKLAYMAPEQAAADDIDKRTDQFAVGVVLWECVTGKRLFVGDSDMELLRKVMRCEIPDPRTLVAQTPRPLAEAILRALRVDRVERFDDLADMEQALASFRFSLGERGVVRLSELVDACAPIEPRPRPGTLALEGAPQPDELPASAAPVERARAEATTRQRGRSDGMPGDGWPSGADQILPDTVPRSDRAAHSPNAHGVERIGLRTAEEAKETRRAWAWAAVVVALGVVLLTVALSLRSPVPPVVAAVAITSVPAGASVWIDGADTGLRTPATLPAQAIGSALDLAARLEGYEPARKRLVVAQDPERVRLELSRGAQLPERPAVALSPESGAAPERPLQAPPSRPTIAPKRARGAAAPAGEGTLSMRTNGGWYHVYLGGRHLGATPLAAVKVPAGTHRLRLVNPETGQRRHIEVTIQRGQELRKTVSGE